MKSSQPTIAVFFGGEAQNYDLSRQTGYAACYFLPRSKYRIVPVHVTPDQRWQVPLGTLPTQGPVESILDHLWKAVPALDSAMALPRLLHHQPSAFFTLLRGSGGDDGSLHSLGRALGVPVVGSPQAACQHTFAKHVGQQLAEEVTKTPYSTYFSHRRASEDVLTDVRAEFAPPFFVKASAAEGSGGVVEVRDWQEAPAAVHQCQIQGDVLVQERVPGNELNVTVFERDGGRLDVLPPAWVLPQHSTFYDAATKRDESKVRFKIATEAAVNSKVAQAISAALDLFELLGCRGTASFDFMVNEHEMVFLEANTVPTFTSATPLRTQLQSAGIHPSAWFDRLTERSLTS